MQKLMVNNILCLTRCLVRSHRVLHEATQFFAVYAELSYQRKSESFFAQPCKPAAMSTQPSLHQRHADNKKIQKRRENEYMAEGWIFLQALASEHGWLPQLLLLRVPVSLSSPSICYLPCILTTAALQNISATSPYHLPGAVACMCQFSLLPKHASLQTQLWGTRPRRAESLWLTPLHFTKLLPHARAYNTPWISCKSLKTPSILIWLEWEDRERAQPGWCCGQFLGSEKNPDCLDRKQNKKSDHILGHYSCWLKHSSCFSLLFSQETV